MGPTPDIEQADGGVQVTLRMFAAARQAAGRSKVDLAAATVGEVLDRAAETFGAAWSQVAANSRTWVNGEPADRAYRLSEGDEVAVLPPVSGGAA